MADIGGTSKILNKKRMTLEQSAMRLNIERMELRSLELEVEKESVAENVKASNKRILELDAQLKLLGD
jgi:hypothetical protein